MTGNSASVEVDGPAANQIAKNLLSNLGISAEDIDAADLGLTFNGTGTTDVTVEADGPLAGVIVAAMAKGIPWDDHNATAIDASFTEADETPQAAVSDDAGEDGDDASQNDSTNNNGAFRPQVTPLVSKVDPEYVEFPGGEPGRIPENTQLHVAGSLLLDYHDVVGDEWATGEELAEFAGDDMSRKQAESAVSRLFIHKGLAVRRRVAGSATRAYEYNATQQLKEEINRLGEYDIDAARETAERHSPT